MLEIIEFTHNDTVGFRLDGLVGEAETKLAYDELEKKMADVGKIKLYMEVESLQFSDITKEAFKEEMRRLFAHPGILVNVAKGALVTDLTWLKRAFEIESALIPTFVGKTFAPGEEAEAREWLETDQRAGQRLDITMPELVETSALKVASGFALGLLFAGLFDSKKRKALSIGVLAGTVLAGIPLAIKVLNNNRQLFECEEEPGEFEEVAAEPEDILITAETSEPGKPVG